MILELIYTKQEIEKLYAHFNSNEEGYILEQLELLDYEEIFSIISG